ncbi:MAG: lysophospholipid acyltransferase family protein, partial [Candidatus Poseidoniaceae archaeon]
MEDVIQAWLRLEKHWKIEPSGKKIGKYRSYGFLRYTVGSLLKIVTRIKTTGRQNIPKSSPFVIAGNHLSHVDPIVIIITSGKKIHYLAKDGHFQNFFLRHFMRLVGQIETNRDTGGKQALSMAADVIANNKILGIFPEGT